METVFNDVNNLPEYLGNIEFLRNEKPILQKLIDNSVSKSLGPFMKTKRADDSIGGFYWVDSIEGGVFWESVLGERNIGAFYKKYPQAASPVEIKNEINVSGGNITITDKSGYEVYDDVNSLPKDLGHIEFLRGHPAILQKLIELSRDKSLKPFIENSASAAEFEGGFDWDKVENSHIWPIVLDGKYPDAFYSEYPKKSVESSEYPKVMMVWNNISPDKKRKRVVQLFLNDKFYAYQYAESMNDLNGAIDKREVLVPWDNAEDFKPVIITKQQIAEKLGLKVDEFKIDL